MVFFSSQSTCFSHKIKNLVPTSICISLIFILAGCASHSPAKATEGLTPGGDYIVTGEYIDHRKQQRYFNVSTGKIAYTDNGEGPVLVMLHGVPTSSWMYRELIKNLHSTMRVITIDFLGYGSSDKPKGGNPIYGPKAQMEYVKALLASLDVTQYSLLFHDMGGLTAWELLRDTTEGNKTTNIENIVVLNTIISKTGFNHPGLKKGFLSRQLSRLYSSQISSASALETTFKNMGLTSNITLSENICRGYVAPMREGSDQALYSFFTGFDDTLFSRLDENIRALKHYSGNTLVVWGAEDKVLTTEQLPILRQYLDIEEQNVIILDDQAHFLAEEIPNELSKQIKQFIGINL